MKGPIRSSTKNKLLIASIVVIAVLTYKVSIEQTIELYTGNLELEREILMADKAPEQLQYYRKESRRIEKFLNLNNSGKSIKEDILHKAAEGSDHNKVLFKNLSQPSSYREESLEIETYEVILQGDYIGLLKTLVFMEDSLESGKVVSVKFNVEKNREVKQLAAHIFIQTSKTWK
jgi:hypothetical protein